MDANAAVKSTGSQSVPQAKSNLRQRVQSLQLPAAEAMPRSGRRWLLGLIVLAVLGIGGYVGYKVLLPPEKEVAQGSTAATNEAAPPRNDSATASPAGANSSNFNSAPSPVSSSVASSGDIALESKGFIIPAHRILISPKVPGMITVLKIEEGQRVKKDDMLAQLETTDYEADYNRAKAAAASMEQKKLELEHGSRKEEISESQAEMQEAEALRNQLSAEWQRIVQLRKSGVATQSEYDLGEANFKTADRRVERLRKAYDLMVIGPRDERIEAARADFDLAKAELAKAKWRLDNCTVKAPSSGTILTKMAEEGNVVNPIVMNGSYSLCEMADLSDLEVELKIQERDVSKIFKGQKCTIRAEAWPDRQYEGYVSRLMPIADRSQGAIPVRVKISVPASEEGVYLKPEMGAIVAFLKGPADPR
jgi:HlyD family secretion protein